MTTEPQYVHPIIPAVDLQEPNMQYFVLQTKGDSNGERTPKYHNQHTATY